MACGKRVLEKLAQTERAFKKLKEVEGLQNKLDKDILYELAAKRFEYTYESLWKTIRLFLLEEKGLECNSPMDCFKALYSVGFINEDVAEVVPRIVRMRNHIVHIYDFSVAQDTFYFIRDRVVPVFEHILGKLKENCRG